MSREFEIFISSTVRDLESIREELSHALEGPGRVVRTSENPKFPVEPGVTSHDACLAVVRNCNAFVLLVGTRFGGEYQKQNKSITWREWEEARMAGLSPIVLVRKDVNDLCTLISKARKTLQAANTSLSAVELDDELSKKFEKETAGYDHAPALARFVDELRKGHEDNWKLDWDGTAKSAIAYVQQNLAVQAAAADRHRRAARTQALAIGDALRELSGIAQRVGLLLTDVRKRRVEKVAAVESILDAVASLRTTLFGFKDEERYTLVVHEARGKKLHPIARVAHAGVPARGRVWAFGQGHVGKAIHADQVMISGDIRQTAAWVHSPDTEARDRENYVSVVAKRYLRASGKPGGVVTLTSARVDHFCAPDQPAVSAFDTIVTFINMVFNVE